MCHTNGLPKNWCWPHLYRWEPWRTHVLWSSTEGAVQVSPDWPIYCSFWILCIAVVPSESHWAKDLPQRAYNLNRQHKQWEGNWGTKKKSDLPKITQQAGGRARKRTHLLHICPVLHPLDHTPFRPTCRERPPAVSKTLSHYQFLEPSTFVAQGFQLQNQDEVVKNKWKSIFVRQKTS